MIFFAGCGRPEARLRDDVDVHVPAAAELLRHRHPEGVQVPQRRAGRGRVIEVLYNHRFIYTITYLLKQQ